MEKFDEFQKERKIYSIDQLRNKRTNFKKLMADGRIPCMFKDGKLIKLEKIRSEKSFPQYAEGYVYFLTEQEFELFSKLKNEISNFKNSIDDTFNSMLITFMNGDKSEFQQLSDILGRITNLGNNHEQETPGWIHN